MTAKKKNCKFTIVCPYQINISFYDLHAVATISVLSYYFRTEVYHV
ncbi:MAG: hypothetical protein MUO82_10735 [Candidatus Thermoplasmatota archaeon]|nr:hypothetical protein [Candidatus Thermoplasmatota archaeon]